MEEIADSKVSLIYPSPLYAPTYGKNIVKVHMLHLFFFLRHNNVEEEVLDLENEMGRPKKEDDIKKFRAGSTDLVSRYEFDLVAISCWSNPVYPGSRRWRPF